MIITTIEGTLEYIKIIFERELTGDEVFMIGIAFHNGILRGIEEMEEKKE